MIGTIVFLAIAVGGIGVMNTMLMVVFERTREIGALRAMGWSRWRVLGLILREAGLLGALGGGIGIGVAFGLLFLLGQIPLYGNIITPRWSLEIFSRALVVAVTLGLVGGLYPALRATRMQPVEALQYE